MVSRQEAKEKRREAILYGALRLFVRKGYAGTKVSDIAEAVGMSTGLMFHYFDSKESLYDELIRVGVEGPMGMVKQPKDEGLAFFENAASSILTYLKTEPLMAYMFLFMRHAMMDENVSDKAKDMLSRFDVYTPTAEVVRRGQQKGSIRDGDPIALSIAFWCAIQGIAEEMALYPDMPCPEAEWLVDIIRKR